MDEDSISSYDSEEEDRDEDDVEMEAEDQVDPQQNNEQDIPMSIKEPQVMHGGLNISNVIDV